MTQLSLSIIRLFHETLRAAVQTKRGTILHSRGERSRGVVHCGGVLPPTTTMSLAMPKNKTLEQTVSKLRNRLLGTNQEEGCFACARSSEVFAKGRRYGFRNLRHKSLWHMCPCVLALHGTGCVCKFACQCQRREDQTTRRLQNVPSVEQLLSHTNVFSVHVHKSNSGIIYKPYSH